MTPEHAPCPKCNGERYDTTYEGYPAEDGGPGPCVTCNGSGTTERRPDPDYSCEALCMDKCIGACGV